MAHNSDNPFSIEYYQLPRRAKWSCGFKKFATITWCISLVIGYLFAVSLYRWIFFGILLNTETVSFSTAFYGLAGLIVTIVVFVTCLYTCRNKLKKLENRHLFYLRDIGLITQNILMKALKSALVCLLLALISWPIMMIIFFALCILTIKRVFVL